MCDQHEEMNPDAKRDHTNPKVSLSRVVSAKNWLHARLESKGSKRELHR